MLRSTISSFFTIAGWVGWVISGFGGLALCLWVLHSSMGLWAAALGFLLSPVAFIATPWYALLVQGSVLPLLICYVGGFTSTVLIGAGAGIRD